MSQNRRSRSRSRRINNTRNRRGSSNNSRLLRATHISLSRSPTRQGTNTIEEDINEHSFRIGNNNEDDNDDDDEEKRDDQNQSQLLQHYRTSHNVTPNTDRIMNKSCFNYVTLRADYVLNYLHKDIGNLVIFKASMDFAICTSKTELRNLSKNPSANFFKCTGQDNDYTQYDNQIQAIKLYVSENVLINRLDILHCLSHRVARIYKVKPLINQIWDKIVSVDFLHEFESSGNILSSSFHCQAGQQLQFCELEPIAMNRLSSLI